MCAQLDSGAAWIADAKAANRRRQENAGKLEELGVSGGCRAAHLAAHPRCTHTLPTLTNDIPRTRVRSAAVRWRQL